MPESPNIGLKLTPKTNTGKKFIDWRTEMSGLEEDSNLMIIDGEIKKIYDSIDEHEASTNIHTTPQEKTTWNGKANKANPSIDGNLAGLDASGNPVDSGKKPSDFAAGYHEHDAEDIVMGTLPVDFGGTGRSTMAVGNFLRGNGQSPVTLTPPSEVAPAIGRGHATCTTPAGTAVKVATSTGFERSASAVVGVKFSYTNTAANPSLNVNGTGNAAIYNALTDEPPVEGEMVAGTHFFMFNGSQWVLLNPYSRGGSTAELHTCIFPNHMVTAVKGTTVVTAAPTAPLGQWAVLQLPELGVWEISMHLPNLTGGVMKTILIDTYGIFYLNFLSGSNTSWGNIIDFARMGIAHKMLPLGFTKSLGVGGSSYDTRIIGFNHDDLANGSGKAPITFQMVRTPVNEMMYPLDLNNAMWVGSSLRSELNNTTYPSIEATVRNAIVAVLKRSARNSADSPPMTDILFLLSERESAGGYIQAHANEGRQYDYYAEGNSLAAWDTPTTVTTQWLRSISRHDNQRFVYMGDNGTPNTDLPSRNHRAFFAFCIG